MAATFHGGHVTMLFEMQDKVPAAMELLLHLSGTPDTDLEHSSLVFKHASDKQPHVSALKTLLYQLVIQHA